MMLPVLPTNQRSLVVTTAAATSARFGSGVLNMKLLPFQRPSWLPHAAQTSAPPGSPSMPQQFGPCAGNCVHTPPFQYPPIVKPPSTKTLLLALPHNADRM